MTSRQKLYLKPDYPLALEEITGPVGLSDDAKAVCTACKTLHYAYLQHYDRSDVAADRMSHFKYKLTIPRSHYKASQVVLTRHQPSCQSACRGP